MFSHLPFAGMSVNWRSSLLALAMLLSGFSALTYQVAWQRALTQSIGSDAISVVLVVTIFMVWLGVGATVVRALLAKGRRTLILVYSLIEFGVGLFGIVSVPLLRGVNGYFAGASIDSVYLDFLVNLVLLGLPIIGMGMTTPLVVQIARREIGNLARTAGLLYGLNIFGASVGALYTGLILLESLGLVGATVLAGLVNILAGAVAILSSAKTSKGLRGEPDASLVSQGGGHTPVASSDIPPFILQWRHIHIAAICYGFGTLALQIVFFRILQAYLTLSTIVFPIILCAYLLLMAIGQWVGGHLADRSLVRLPRLAASLFLAGTILVVAALNMPPKWAASFGTLRFTSFNGSLVPNYPWLIGDPPVLASVLFCLAFMASVVAWSALFPVVLRAATHNIREVGSSFGRLYGSYTVGNVAGTFLTGVFAFPILGTSGALFLSVVIVGAGTLILLQNETARFWRLLVIGTGLVCFLLTPASYYRRFALDAYTVTDVFEGRVGVATVTPTSSFYSIIDMSRTASASALIRDPQPGDQYEAWRWNHSELLVLDASFRPKRILIIGLGHAYLPHALLDLPFVEEIVIVDLSDEIVSAVRKHTATSARRVFSDPRVRVVVGDGRRYVQSALKRGETFDLIQLKVNEPWHAGAGNLFTVEFFELTKRLLSPGGYLGVRPLLGHLSDGLKVFGSAVFPGYYHLFFKNGPMHEVQVANASGDISAAWSRQLPGDPAVDGARPGSLNVMWFHALPSALATDPNTDNNPTFEYYWWRQRLGVWKSPRTSLTSEEFDQYRKNVPVAKP